MWITISKNGIAVSGTGYPIGIIEGNPKDAIIRTKRGKYQYQLRRFRVRTRSYEARDPQTPHNRERFRDRADRADRCSSGFASWWFLLRPSGRRRRPDLCRSNESDIYDPEHRMDRWGTQLHDGLSNDTTNTPIAYACREL